MQASDRIVSINGQAVSTYAQFQQLAKKQAAISPRLAIVVQRQGKSVPLSITARHESIQGSPVDWYIGATGRAHEQTVVRYGPLRALGASLQATWGNATHTLGMIGQMLSGRASTNNLSGVIGIAQVANSSAQMGLPWFLNFLAMVSLSLAILNLLPIPLLDGGHLLYYLVELVKGSPVSEQVMIVGQYIGLALLFTLMGLAFYNDIHRTLFT
jgi:regulator of sigma E protease